MYTDTDTSDLLQLPEVHHPLPPIHPPTHNEADQAKLQGRGEVGGHSTAHQRHHKTSQEPGAAGCGVGWLPAQDLGELYPLSRKEHQEWGNVYLYAIRVKSRGGKSLEAFVYIGVSNVSSGLDRTSLTIKHPGYPCWRHHGFIAFCGSSPAESPASLSRRLRIAWTEKEEVEACILEMPGRSRI